MGLRREGRQGRRGDAAGTFGKASVCASSLGASEEPEEEVSAKGGPGRSDDMWSTLAPSVQPKEISLPLGRWCSVINCLQQRRRRKRRRCRITGTCATDVGQSAPQRT